MPTLKQKRTAQIRLETYNDPSVDKATLVEMGGYGKSAQKTPAKVLESQGYKQALAEYGLTDELITTALVEDIQGKPKRRVRELELGADILGMRDREEKGNKTLVVMITGETAQRYARTTLSPEPEGSSN